MQRAPCVTVRGFALISARVKGDKLCMSVFDRLLLFLFGLAIAAASLTGVAMAIHWISFSLSRQGLTAFYENDVVRNAWIVLLVLFLLASLRFLYVSVRRNDVHAQSIDQRSDYGDIRISMETVENLALKAAAKIRGVKDLRARVKVAESGIIIVIRAIVDGDYPIPSLTEDVQRSVKNHVEEITGIPVSDVSVFVANITQSPSFKSRVE